MRKALSIPAIPISGLSFDTAISVVAEPSVFRLCAADDGEFEKGIEYLSQAIRLYHPAPKVRWYAGLVQSPEELYAMWHEQPDMKLFSFYPPSKKSIIARKIKLWLIQTGLVRTAGKGTGCIVYVVMR
jgi:hypothetical protein